MTLDEAIKHAEEVAEENEKSLRGWKECINRGTVGWSDFDKEKVDTSITRCSKCAEEHRQLAEWLKDYKRLKEQEPKTVLYSGDGYADGYMVYDMAECPNCGYEYEDGDKDWGLSFCPSCGQKLNWESEDKIMTRGFESVCTNDEARDYFKKCGLTYNDITEGDMLSFTLMINRELKKSNKVGETSVNTMSLSKKIDMTKNTNGTIKNCYLYLNSHYFTRREAISFNTDGFIGFAGWADQGNLNPLKRAFLAWCDELQAEKRGGGMTEIIEQPFDWNDNMSEIAQEDFSMIQKSLSYGTAASIGMALAKLKLLEKQGV